MARTRGSGGHGSARDQSDRESSKRSGKDSKNGKNADFIHERTQALHARPPNTSRTPDFSVVGDISGA
jgi:hypothetical protein